MNVSIKSDLPELMQIIKKLPKIVQEKVVKPALKDAAKAGQTLMVRGIAQEYNLSRQEISQTMSVRVNESASIVNGGINYKAQLASTTRRTTLNIIRFVEKKVTLSVGRRRAKAGVQSQVFVKIKKQGKAKSLGNRTFIGNRGRTVFYRVPGQYMPRRKGHNKHSERIEPVITLGITQMFNVRRIQQPVLVRIRENFASRVEHYSKRYLGKIGKNLK